MDNPRLTAFLAAIREFPHVGRAAQAAQIHRTAHYRRYKADPDYRALFDEAWAIGIGVIRDAAITRAVEGYQEPVIYKGQYQTIGKGKKKRLVTVTKYPERLMMKVLGAEIPEVYNRNRIEHSGPEGSAIPLNIKVEFIRPKQA